MIPDPFPNRDPVMTFINTPDYRHDTPECLGILLANLGTPDTPIVSDVRRYLAEFLWDRRVVEMAFSRRKRRII